MTAERLAHLRERLDAADYPADESSPLTRLFALGVRLDEPLVCGALPSPLVDDCVALGILSRDSGTIASRYRLERHHGLVFALDPPEISGPFDHLHVMAPSGSTKTLVQAMQREPRTRSLEVGAGSGCLALLMAGHSKHVVATDLNPHALEATRLSAGLNGIGNVETRLGSWFKPVATESFDQIVCNPPFVISPESPRLYRDSGMQGDAVCRLIVENLPRHLNPGGVGQVLLNWIIDDRGRDSLDDWALRSGCEVLLQRLPTFEPADYARHWLGDRADGPAFEEWMAYYRRLGIESISSGILTLTRR